MADANRIFAPIARERSRILDRLGVEARRLRARHRPPRGERPSPTGSHGSSAALDALDEPLVFPAHPRTRDALRRTSRTASRRSTPLGFLDFTALTSQARVVLTDSGGVQKEAYWNARSLRDDAAQHGVARHGRGRRQRPRRRRPRGDRPRSGRRRGFPPRRRICTATATPPSGSRQLCTLPGRDRGGGQGPPYDVAVIGAGYVGVPLAQTFADAGQARARRRRRAGARRGAQPRLQPHRGRSVGASRAPREVGPHRRDDRLRPAEAGEGDPDRATDAADASNASPT